MTPATPRESHAFEHCTRAGEPVAAEPAEQLLRAVRGEEATDGEADDQQAQIDVHA
jgi:hypothetical protein